MKFTQRIFFGHQSVGVNILDGLREHLKDDSIKIIESRTTVEGDAPCLIHCAIGQNKDPISKLRDFVSLMDNEFGDNVEIACFKFCYIDIQQFTNVDQLFHDYHKELTLLEQRFKKTRFLHITTPLRTTESGLRLILMKLIGRKSQEAGNNLKRQMFNDLMKRQYAKNAALFDLAGIESTHPSGSRCKSNIDGIQVFSLSPEYTDDGGHLNSVGRKIAAKGFLDSIKKMCQ